MLIFSKTYENINNKNYPIEDNYYATNDLAVIADGITRDKINGVYPRFSGAELASKTLCQTVKNNHHNISSLKKLLILGNNNIRIINNIFVKECDYLENDWYGTVASIIRICNNILEYAYICDCGVLVYDKNGKIKFQTHDDMTDSAPYFDTGGIPWSDPRSHVIIRSEFRNNPKRKVDGKCVSFGALTGEETSVSFIKSGNLAIDDTDIIIVYSDGFKHYFGRDDFFEVIKDFNEERFNNYISNLEKENNKLYGDEKTIIIMKKN